MSLPVLSWSMSRQRTFNECRRKYWYNYYPEDAEIVRLRKLSAMPLWTGNITHDAAEHYLKTASRVPTREEAGALITEITDSMGETFRASEAGTGQLRLQEHEYGVPISILQKQVAAGNVIKSLTEFFTGPVLAEMFEVGRENWLSVEKREEFEVISPAGRTAKAVVKMDAAYRRASGEVVVVDWKTGRKVDAGNVAQIGGYALFAFRAGWAKDPAEIKAVLAYLSLGEYKPAEITWASLTAATRMIGESYDAMADAVRDGAGIEQFPQAESSWPCRTCPFRRPCGRM